tara:strand:+ start:450 stop:1292 length:843 start_codon:yes stop_codon:yes gene_type:complete
MKELHIVNGGMGKCIIFTSLLNKLEERYGQKLYLHTVHNEVLDNHPSIKKIIPTYDWLDRGGCLKNFKEFNTVIHNDPYYSSYIWDDVSMKETFFNLYDLEFENDKNDIPITYHSELVAERYENKQYYIFQFTGGQSVRTSDNYASMGQYRNYDFNRALKLIEMLSYSFPNVNFLDFSFANEYNFDYPNVTKYHGNFIGIQTLLKNSLGFISIDSSLQHVAATKQIDKKGIVLWNSVNTTPEKVGYEENTNLIFNGLYSIQINEIEILEKIEPFLSRPSI